MPLSPEFQARLDDFLRYELPAPEPTPLAKTAPFGTQVVRGAVRGGSFGLVAPFQEAGEGGIPETLASIGTSVLPWMLSARLGGVGVAMLGKLFPQLLASGVPPAKAMELLTQLRFGPIKEALSGPGRTLALGLGGAGMAGVENLAPELTGAPARSGSEIAASVGLGAGLGALGGALLKGRGVGVGTQAIEPQLTSVIERLRTSGLPQGQLDKAIQDLREVVKTQSPEEAERILREVVGVYPTTPPVSPEAGQLGRQAFNLEPLGSGGVARLLPETPPIAQAVSEVAPPPLRSGTQVAERLEQRVNEVAQHLRSPESGISREEAEIQIQRMTELARTPTWKNVVKEQVGIVPRSPDSEHVERGTRLFGRFLGQPGQEFELESLGVSRAAEMISRLPEDMDVAARAAARHPFPSIIAGGSDAPELVRSVLERSEIDPNRLLPGGYNQTWLMKTLGSRLGLLTLRWLLHGTAAEDLPMALARVDAEVGPIKDTVLKASGAAPSLSWSPATKTTLMRLFYEHPRALPAEVDAMVLREAPEAAEQLPFVRKLYEFIRQEYVQDGVLREEQNFNNYWPVVRETFRPMVEQNRVQMVEKGEGFFPQTLRNRIGRRDIAFAKKRVIQNPEDFPKNMSYDDTMDLYLTQYARHRALRNHLDEINQLLDGVPPEFQDHVAKQMGVWVGVPGPEGAFPALNDISKVVRNVQFMRTIGGSLLSPLVNTFQRANTFAMVRPSAFVQAFRDAGDPARLALLERSAFGRELLLAEQGGGFSEALGKVGVEDVVGTGKLEGFSQWLAGKAGRLFSWSERGNQIHALMAGLREAEARGITDVAQQIRFAETILKDTQFIHSPADMPLAFIGASGHPRMLAQFQTFRMNQFRFMLRLVEGAQNGMTDFLRTGNPEVLQQVMPLVKFAGVSGLLGGGKGLLLPDLLEEKLTRAWYGKTMAIPGVPDLIGLSLSNQLGLGAVGLDDLDSMMFYLPGPAVNHLQGILGSITGRSFGKGLDLSSAGQDLSLDEQTRLVMQSLPVPGALQASRISQMLRLIQTNGEYRQSLDPLEAIGLARPSGDLMSQHIATRIQQLGTAVGIQSTERGLERRGLEQEQNMARDFDRTVGRAASLLVEGRQGQAERMLARFQAKWGDVLEERGAMPIGLSTMSQATIKDAAKRQVLPPGQRKLMPKALRGREAFVRPYESLESLLVPPAQ